jgi:hypothetical protein
MRYKIWFSHTSEVQVQDLASAREAICQQARQCGNRNPKLFSIDCSQQGRFVYLSKDDRNNDQTGSSAFAVVRKLEHGV